VIGLLYQHDATCAITQNGIEIPERLEDKTEMVFVVEMTKQTQTVKFVLVVGIVQALEKLELLQTSLVPEQNMYYKPSACSSR